MEWDKDSNILSLERHAMCKKWVWQHWTRTTKTATLRARSRVHVVFRLDVSLDLGFHVVIGVGRLNVQQDGFICQLHFTTHTQYQVQSSFLLNVVVRFCPVIVNSICIPKFLHILHRENGSCEVLSLHKMDSGMWQTIGTINVLHSLHKWLPPILSCGKCASTLSFGVISRLKTLQVTLKTQNEHQAEFCAFLEV